MSNVLTVRPKVMIASLPFWAYTPVQSIGNKVVARKAGSSLQGNTISGSRHTEVSVEHALSENKKPRLVQYICFVFGVVYCNRPS